MARLQGPKHRMCRRVGERLCSSARCPVTRRNQPPGVHGPKGHRRLTEFGGQLKEKQKARFMYGVMERQFRKYYEKAVRSEGNTADLIWLNLERRLDNVVYRLGFAKTRSQARQLVSHGWVTVNGKRVDIPSYAVSVGDIVKLKDSAKGSDLVKFINEGKVSEPAPQWLSLDINNLEGKVLALPKAEDFPANVNMTLVVEYYSR